jgi:hypothetical protein
MLGIGTLVMVKRERTGLPADQPGQVVTHNPSDPRPWLVQLIEHGSIIAGKRYWCKAGHLAPDPVSDPPSWTLPDLTAKQRAMAIIQNKALLHSAPRNPGFLLVAIIEAIRAAEQRKDNTA